MPCPVFIPNSFSPNGDGINDYFQIYGAHLSGITVVNMSIFDRWGNQLFEQKLFPADSIDGLWWDGTFRGKSLDESIVVYFIELESGGGSVTRYKGELQILR